MSGIGTTPRVPRFANTRTVLGVPFAIIGAFLFIAAACFLMATDKIVGRPVSRELLR